MSTPAMMANMPSKVLEIFIVFSFLDFTSFGQMPKQIKALVFDVPMKSVERYLSKSHKIKSE